MPSRLQRAASCLRQSPACLPTLPCLICPRWPFTSPPCSPPALTRPSPSTLNPAQFLKAVRLRVEMHWSSLARAQACRCDADVETGCGQSTKHLPMGIGAKSMATVTPAIPPPKACCGAAAAGDSSSSADEPVPTSNRRKYWLRQGGFGGQGKGALVVNGRQLMTRWQVGAGCSPERRCVAAWCRGVGPCATLYRRQAAMLLYGHRAVGSRGADASLGAGGAPPGLPLQPPAHAFFVVSPSICPAPG